jgi:hypothetical protein
MGPFEDPQKNSTSWRIKAAFATEKEMKKFGCLNTSSLEQVRTYSAKTIQGDLFRLGMHPSRLAATTRPLQIFNHP